MVRIANRGKLTRTKLKTCSIIRNGRCRRSPCDDKHPALSESLRNISKSANTDLFGPPDTHSTPSRRRLLGIHTAGWLVTLTNASSMFGQLFSTYAWSSLMSDTLIPHFDGRSKGGSTLDENVYSCRINYVFGSATPKESKTAVVYKASHAKLTTPTAFAGADLFESGINACRDSRRQKLNTFQQVRVIFGPNRDEVHKQSLMRVGTNISNVWPIEVEKVDVTNEIFASGVQPRLIKCGDVRGFEGPPCTAG